MENRSPPLIKSSAPASVQCVRRVRVCFVRNPNIEIESTTCLCTCLSAHLQNQLNVNQSVCFVHSTYGLTSCYNLYTDLMVLRDRLPTTESAPGPDRNASLTQPLTRDARLARTSAHSHRDAAHARVHFAGLLG